MGSAARVDKGWKSQGLGKYPLEAILGTLEHYGARTSEVGFKEMAQQQYPLSIARSWLASWKGTGQFASFPPAAAQELWRRLVPDRLEPQTLTEALVALVQALGEMLQGSPDAPVGKAFEAVNALKPKMPQERGAARRDFVEEVFAYLSKEFVQAFDGLAEQLAKEGHVEDAQSLAELEEFLFAERQKVATALVQAARGQKAEAEQALLARADDASLPTEARVLAVDALIHLGATAAARGRAEAILDAAEKAEDHHLALAMVDRLAHLLREGQHQTALEALAQRAEKLVAAHDQAHPHHRH